MKKLLTTFLLLTFVSHSFAHDSRLNSRYYKTTYIVIPLYLKMKTKQIGAMTYYGEFGLNASIRLKSKVTDDVSQYKNVSIPTLGFQSKPASAPTDLAMTDDMNIFK